MMRFNAGSFSLPFRGPPEDDWPHGTDAGKDSGGDEWVGMSVGTP